MKKFLAILLSVVLLSVAFAGCNATAPQNTQKQEADDYKIALITMDAIDSHWQTLKDGAQKAADELGVKLEFATPEVKDDDLQIKKIEAVTEEGYNAIIIAANTADAPVEALKKAAAKGIKIIYVDSTANFPAEATFATDNSLAGKKAAQTMLEELKNRNITSGTIGIVGVSDTVASCNEREKGFREGFNGTAFTILDTQYCNGNVAHSKEMADRLLLKSVCGIFSLNEGTTEGVGNAVSEAGANAVCVGFDRSDAIIQFIKNDVLYATMVQNPDVMGYEAVKAAVDVLNGKSLNGEVHDTGVSVVTKNDFK
ncbi:MAG: substrate-binding domain-containing protein [Oscillospiraceae bacterium]|nr:substrate-binding domain-containing protein [Candidatus Equicaccousia limihippi]